MRTLILLSILGFMLAGCERLGITDPAKEAEARDAEGRAIGSACRQSGRALEDCYVLNAKAQKAAIFNGWKDMNDYMIQNKLDIVKPELQPNGEPVGSGKKEEAAAKPDAQHADASAPAGEQSAASEEGMSKEQLREARRVERAARRAKLAAAAGESGAKADGKADTKDASKH